MNYELLANQSLALSNLLFADFQPMAAIATTPTAVQTLQPIYHTTGATLWVPPSLSYLENVQIYPDDLKAHIASLWRNHRALIFCLATGAVVRLIAPLLTDKSQDPAVIVIDQKGQFVISLCSGHQGKADQLTRLIATQLNAIPILTGAATGSNLPGIDILGIPFGWRRGDGDWTGVSGAIARGEPVQVIQEVGSILWQKHLPPAHPFQFNKEQDLSVMEGCYPRQDLPLISGGLKPNNGGERELSGELLPVACSLFPLPKGVELPEAGGGDLLSLNSSISAISANKPGARIWISFTQRRFAPKSDIPQVQWHPRVLWVGIGCERGTSRELIETAIGEICQRYDLAEGAIAGIATIDIKADEVGLVELCRDRNLPLRTFTADLLRTVTVPNPSVIVDQEVGTPSVAEAAAIYASLPLNQGRGQEIGNREQLHLTPLLVPKQVFKLDDQPGAVTVAIAVSEREYTGRSGQLLLVGTGPGKLDQITPAAQTAISAADAVIGYSLYIDLITPILRPGQIIEPLPITQERQRAQRAIELAQWGLTVAVVSSGDCGIYGMAGLVLEELKSLGWDGKTPAVQVFPGISALQAAASRVGAPLMHDFCAISLSDLLTPWDVIHKRLEAAAAADFVMALYNPRSQKRTTQLAIAHQILLQYRHPQTPVAIVHSAYRQDEEITLTTLDKLLDIPIDMLTTVLIGNQSTTLYGDWMITPRGYQ